MVFDIVLSERASKDLNSTLHYLEDKWSFKVADEFAKRIDVKINFIKENPYQYPPFKNKKQVRKCVVNEQVSLFYRILTQEVQIITLFDNRQNPSKLKFSKTR